MRLRIIDAFTDRPFSGNPAGVMLLDAFPDDERLQRIAAEVNLSETAFAHPLEPGGEADWALRWFTPLREVDLCGHATLATAHALTSDGRVAPGGGPLRFATRSGVLTAAPNADGGHTLDFPTAPLTEEPLPEGLAEALGAVPLSVHDTGPHCGDLLLELPDEKTVRELEPDHRALVRHSRRGVIATAPADDPAAGYDFVSRGFFPQVGIDEDPVTGSAHTALAPFWTARLGRDRLTGFQGGARTGVVRTEVRGDRTLLTGDAVTVLDGELLV
ncbi:oxidoreductase [Streptomyces albidoflavus]|uniref:PhzF family phenazine biosynthesis protein n=1 Tax=Streptomyces albidoflavus TaxID=1886 RepID=UPI000BAE50DD|nr:PhzF family phenazine biosynthesis protein [Streptomyces albidoflavus]MBF4137651.1 PhzF family phenazine biosynthesis protein [Streptomyces albidoflavus]PAX83973.1 oxidoreductase [Streptomyces albidoflavus]PAX84655.1 oxidoreductase [Streptomyces albidoflavus]PBO17634.1 oxidoreductase [Streptomyces albidoflavus]PBO24091.1 oxidoreductase [Streptomyces albidoflavus]